MYDLSSGSAQAAERPTRVRYAVLAAACTVAIVTYVHRVGFAVGAPEIKKDLNLSNQQMGYLLSAFFWAYGGFQILGGWLGDRLGARHLLTSIVFAWSLVTGAIALVVYVPVAYQFAFLLTLRFLFGVFQAGGFPLLSRVNADWMPITQRGTSQGLIWMSSRLGGALIPFWLHAMFDWFGNWRTPFWIIAFVGFAWCACVWPWFRDRPEQSPLVNKEELQLIAQGRSPSKPGKHRGPWRRLLTSRSAWAVCLAYGFSGFSSTFFLGWLPMYLTDYRHFNSKTTALLTTLPMFFGAFACLVGGTVSDMIIRLTGNRKWGRRINGTISMAIASVAFGSSVLVEDVTLLAFLYCLTFVCSDIAMPSAWASCADIGERSAGTLGGAMNMMANIAGAVAALVAGYLFQQDRPGLVFLIFSACYMLACLSWLNVDVTKPVTEPEEPLLLDI